MQKFNRGHKSEMYLALLVWWQVRPYSMDLDFFLLDVCGRVCNMELCMCAYISVESTLARRKKEGEYDASRVCVHITIQSVPRFFKPVSEN